MKMIPDDVLESFILEKSNNINNLQKQPVSKTPSVSHKPKKWDAKCDACARAPVPHLWLRNNVFYGRIELPRVDGKRRYKRFSLHTSNYYEAQTMINQRQYIEHTVLNAHRLFDKMIVNAWPEGMEKPKEPKELYAFAANFAFVQKVAPKINPQDFKQLSVQIDTLASHLDQLDSFQQTQVEIMRKMLDQLVDLNAQLRKNQVVTPSIPVPTSPKYTLEYVLSMMLQKKDICAPEKIRKRNTLTKMFEVAELTLQSEYDEYNTPEKISTISDYIQGRTDLQGNSKRKYVRYLQEFMKTAHRLSPDTYKLNLMELLPDIKKTNRYAIKSHLPYSESQLMEMFDPRHDFFKKNTDLFWICAIALFTGARRNAATTLQYQDIVQEEGIDCIHFTKEGSEIKQLKNDATTRFVPVHNQLRELGFLDFVKNRQKQLKAKGSDFIFPRCQTSGGNYNDKLIVRTFTQFLLKIKVKSSMKDGYDFHSFRKNASLMMQKAGLSEAFIYQIIGWDSDKVMLHHYSPHTVAEKKLASDKFEYDFLKPHFAYWKTFMADKV